MTCNSAIRHDPYCRIGMPSLAALPTQADILQKSRGTQPFDADWRQVLLAITPAFPPVEIDA
jgi:hypothetical protein